MTRQLAIDGGTPVRTEPFPAWPVFDEREEQAVLTALRSGAWGENNGTRVVEFGKAFAAFQGAKHAVCVPNGTIALELALQTLGIGPGDEVITTPYTFIATSASILTLGARPIFVDIDPETYNLDPDKIEASITPRTKAILPVHLGGQPADMDAIRDVAQRHGLKVIEDACQAWGSQWQGQGVGAIGDLGAFSFQSSKNITSGEGGIVLTNDDELYERAWSLHNVGRVRDGAWYQHELLGRNLRMPELAAAILLVQLERLPEHMAIRDTNAGYLTAALTEEVPGITPIATDPRVTRESHHLYQMRYDQHAFGGRSRDEFLTALQAEGITPTSAGYVPLHQSPAIQRTLTERFGADSLTANDLPVSEAAGKSTVWLQQTALLGTQTDMDSIIDAMKKIQGAWGH
jgi:dTDP-4-amino-4,6-dideoxygalactose transaminase